MLGRAEGRQEALAEAEARRRAEDVLMILRLRGAVMPDEFRQRILRCPDPDVLRQWLGRAVTVGSPREIFDDEAADEDPDAK